MPLLFACNKVWRIALCCAPAAQLSSEFVWYTLNSGGNSFRSKKGQDLIFIYCTNQTPHNYPADLISRRACKSETVMHIINILHPNRALQRRALPQTLLLLHAIYHRTLSNFPYTALLFIVLKRGMLLQTPYHVTKVVFNTPSYCMIFNLSSCYSLRETAIHHDFSSNVKFKSSQQDVEISVIQRFHPSIWGVLS